MLTVAYLANEFPSPVEPYVGGEIGELRKRGVRVVTASVRKPRETASTVTAKNCPEIILQSSVVAVLPQATWLCLRKWKRIAPLLGRIALHGNERLPQRVKALIHTLLGACYAVLLEKRGVEHIHVHHGYFGSWIAMTAAQLLGVGFSMTLHGSDLLLHGSFLDVKLTYCTFCFTVSEYNRRYILERHPDATEKVLVSRMGVEVLQNATPLPSRNEERPFTLLAVGRLHPVKDHAFLVRACAQLAVRDVSFQCLIAGEGGERRRLESAIHSYRLQGKIKLLGQVSCDQLNTVYNGADVVVLTSRSEGIPLVLMEAMARGKVVLAPAITGIPELVVPGHTGFLYEPGSLDGIVDRLLFIWALLRAEGEDDLQHPVPAGLRSAARQLHWLRHAAQVQVRHKFNREKNLKAFADQFLERVTPRREAIPDESFVLQQI
jgi:colanic acid/amylovoran biosynthesis glycosyltransferase